MATSSSASVYGRLRNIRPNFDVVFRFPIDAVSVQRTQNGTCWKGTWKRRWAMVWTEYRRWRDQVRGCYHRRRVYIHTSFRSLVQSFPEASLGISVAVDGQIFQTDVYSASHPPTQSPRPRKLSRWGGRAVVVLIGIRLGIDGVNPIYYETIKVCDSFHLFFFFFFTCQIQWNMKALYTLPQSVGIAGGRPSSSYYFVGSQADNLFYLDPHHTRATVPLRPPTQTQTQTQTPTTERERERGIPIRQATPERGSVSPPPPGHHHRSPTSPASSRTGSSTFSYPTASPSPLSKQLSTSSSSSGGAHARWNSAGANANANGGGGGSVLSGEAASDSGLDATQVHYVSSYSPAELRTFHCERVRKMPLSGLDPSMLIGFLCKTEADWIDLRRRVAEVRDTFMICEDNTLTGYASYSRTIRRSSRSSMSLRRGRMLTIVSNQCRIPKKTKTTCRKIKTQRARV